jgi:hypothetical protein
MKYNAPYGSTDPDAGYVDKDTPGAVRGSVPPAAAIEMPQREIVDVIIKAGFTPADGPQLATAIQSGRLNYAVVGGSANDLTATLVPAPAALMDGFPVRLRLAFNNTGPMTFNLNSLGQKQVVRFNGNPTARGDFNRNTIADLAFDLPRDRWIVTSPIRSGSGAGQQVFKTPGAMYFTVPDGVFEIEVEAWGGGGGGGGVGSGGGGSAGGGGAGAPEKLIMSVTPGDILIGFVGAGGPGGGLGGSGANGGSTGFAGLLTANGGVGGKPNPTGDGGAGGVGSGGYLGTKGGSGTAGASGASVSGGPGGSSGFGGAGGGGGFGAAGAGEWPGGGGGGSGSAGPNNGGAGADGGIIIKWR